MDYIKGIPREQAYLFTDCLDNIIDVDNEVRIIDVFVESINIEKFGFASELIYKDLPVSNQYLLDTKFDFLAENSKTLKTTKRKNLKYLGWAVLGGLIGGLPSGLIAYWTGINTIASIGATSGAIALLTKKINDEKKKNAL